MKNKLLYTSDMHGNEKQFKTFVDYALEIKPSVIIIGGELPPKGGRFVIDDYIGMQRKFISERLPELLKPIKQGLPKTQIYVTPGNDDCKVNDDVLNANQGLFINVDGKRAQTPSDLEIVGYSFVPITPFRIKDREKYDLTNVSEEVAIEYAKRQKGYNLQGVVSVCEGNSYRWQDIQFTDKDKADSIQKDLENKLYTENPRKTIYVIHTPPSNTPLDIIGNEKHVGSFSVRDFIEKYQPYLTLHGHIHETVDMSGEYKTKIGDTWCMSAGNHNYDSKLAVLVMDLDNPVTAERIKLSCTSFGRLLNKLRNKRRK